MEYARDAPPRAVTSYEERYSRGAPVDLDPPIREGYRDYPPRPEYGTKRKHDDPEYMDPYYDDYRVSPPFLKIRSLIGVTAP
jgi:hypothetical protein